MPHSKPACLSAHKCLYTQSPSHVCPVPAWPAQTQMPMLLKKVTEGEACMSVREERLRGEEERVEHVL